MDATQQSQNNDPICNKCQQPCTVIEVDDPCWDHTGANLGYQPSHGESDCCRTDYTISKFFQQEVTG